jgi:hypothetical protein
VIIERKRDAAALDVSQKLYYLCDFTPPSGFYSPVLNIDQALSIGIGKVRVVRRAEVNLGLCEGVLDLRRQLRSLDFLQLHEETLSYGALIAFLVTWQSEEEHPPCRGRYTSTDTRRPS